MLGTKLGEKERVKGPQANKMLKIRLITQMLLMKNVLFLFLLAFLVGCQSNQNLIVIPAGEAVQVAYPQYEAYEVVLNNRSKSELDVKVIGQEESQELRGFGLVPRGEATVMVEKTAQLNLINTGPGDVKVKFTVQEIPPEKLLSPSGAVSFTLRNASLQSIPLIIPGVMNPNLSPMSNSGVSLKWGQEILFRENRKNYVLLTVNENIIPESTIEVSSLLKARRKELGLD